MTPIAIIGAGGFGREVLDILEACNAARAHYDILGFIVDRRFGEPGAMINDCPILGDFGWLAPRVDDVTVVCAVGAPESRYKLVRQAEALGCRFATIIHPSVIKTRWMTIGEGTVIAAGCVLTNTISIGRHVHLNLSCTVGHDVTIADFVSVAPGVLISGNVVLEQGAYIGTGTNLIEKTSVGAWSIVGAGSTVTRDIPPNRTAVGVPARVIKERAEGWQLL